jgi:hypothetical protein
MTKDAHVFLTTEGSKEITIYRGKYCVGLWRDWGFQIQQVAEKPRFADA